MGPQINARPATRDASKIPLPVWGRAGWGLFMALHDNAEIRRIVYVCHSKEIGGAELYLDGLIRFAFRLYRRLARVNIASSKAGWQSLVRRYGFPESSTELIHNGANLERFAPSTGDERRAIRLAIADELAGHPWPDDILLSCTIARFSVQKGLFDLVTAAAEVARRLPAVRFVLAGDGELRDQLKARVTQLHLKDRVLFAGARPLAELARWLGAADLFVLSSHYEGMPLSLIEAMAAGCPVVATSVGGVTDVVADDSVGRLVPPKKPDVLAEAIVDVLSNANQRRAMATAARARAVSAFDINTCYQKTTAIYAQILR